MPPLRTEPAPRPDVTFVVPTRNSAATLAACLASCRDQPGASVELIVVDNHSTDATQAIAAQHADRVIVAGPERSAQRNLGVAAASGPIVAVIDSDMTVHAEVAALLRAAFDGDPRLGAVVLPEYGAGRGLWAAARRLEKHLYLGQADVEAARGFRRSAYLEVGGYQEDLVGGEDWDLPDRVVGAGWRVSRIAAGVDHHEPPLGLAALFAKKRYYGRGLAAYRERAGAAARPLVRTSLLSRPGALLRRPHATAALVVIKLVEAAGIATGMADHRRRAQA